jgi:hypothetical protein
VVFVPSVAELPICQKTLQPLAIFVRTTFPVTVVRVDGTWKIQTVLGLPCPSNVSGAALIEKDDPVV